MDDTSELVEASSRHVRVVAGLPGELDGTQMEVAENRQQVGKKAEGML
jgi:hypothetical protein